MTSKQLVINTLEFKNYDRVARDLWTLPWADDAYPQEIKKICNDFPLDIVNYQIKYKEKGIKSGNMYDIGISVDDWGCVFHNIKKGIIGEVKEPLVREWEWEDYDKVHIPEEWLSFDVAQVNRDLENYVDKFVICGLARPFEQLQFIRGTENLFIDLMDMPPKMEAFLEKMQDLYLRYFEKVANTNIDAIFFMDDWGSQNSLLINPVLWRKIFKPLYRQYISIAKKYGKKTFMHSDGFTLEIIPDLIEIGLDAINSQIFCIGLDKLEKFRGKITFWGEIDRQHILPYGKKEDVQNAVGEVYKKLYDNGGVIAQCEFGIGAKPENVYEVYSAWDKMVKNK